MTKRSVTLRLNYKPIFQDLSLSGQDFPITKQYCNILTKKTNYCIGYSTRRFRNYFILPSGMNVLYVLIYDAIGQLFIPSKWSFFS